MEQVVIPEWVAKRMTFPEKVCDWVCSSATYAQLQECGFVILVA